MKFVQVPFKFQPDFSGKPYPSHQRSNLIEKRCADYFCSENSFLDSDYIYLPILWTSYYVNNNYGDETNDLQDYINKILKEYPDKKFVTVVQYAGGTLISIPNSKIFSCSGTNYCLFDGFGKYIKGDKVKHETSEYIPIPLKCDDHKGIGDNTKFKVGFVGRLITHPCRHEIFNKLKNNSRYKILDSDQLIFKRRTFNKVTRNSIFTLAPRGYGPTSFRLLEAMQMGSIPIYVSDYHWLPFAEEINWSEICLMVKDDNIENIPYLVDKILENGEHIKMKEKLRNIYDIYFSWNGIINNIKKRIAK